MTRAADLTLPTTPAEAHNLRAWALDQLPEVLTADLGAGTVTLDRHVVERNNDVIFTAVNVSVADEAGQEWTVEELEIHALFASLEALRTPDGTPADHGQDEALSEHIHSIFVDDLELWLSHALTYWAHDLALWMEEDADRKRPSAKHVRAREAVNQCILQLAALEIPDGHVCDVALRLAEDFKGVPAELVNTAHGIAG